MKNSTTALLAVFRARLPRLHTVNRPIPIASYRYSPMRFAQNAGQVQSGLLDEQDDGKEGAGAGASNSDPTLKSTILRMFESAATTFASIFILGCVVSLMND